MSLAYTFSLFRVRPQSIRRTSRGSKCSFLVPKMCFSSIKSKTFRWIRICILWSIIFLGGCLYVFHSKRGVNNTSFISHDTYYSNILTSRSIFDSNGKPDIESHDDNNIMTVFTSGVFIKSESNETNSKSVKTAYTNNNETEDFSVSKYLDESSSKENGIYPSSNPLYVSSKEMESSGLHHQPPQRHESNSFIPTYEDVVRWYMTKNNIKRKTIPLPPPYKKWNVHWTIRHSGMFPRSLYSSPSGEYPEQRLPKAILIGAGKCGTRAVIEFLGMHPCVVPARQEVHFFDREENFYHGLDWYIGQMPLSFTNQITVEKSPSYIWSYVALREIRKTNEKMKLMVILRDPVERVISQSIRTRHEDIRDVFLELDEAGQHRIKSRANTVQWSIYVKYLRWWMEAFPPDQIHVVEAKELAADPSKEMQQIERFLGVPPLIQPSNFYFNETKGFYCMRPLHLEHEIICLSKGKGREHPRLEPWLKKLLYDFFRPYNEELFSLLGRRFDWGYKE